MVLGRAEMRRILRRSRSETFSAGEYLFHQGDAGERVYLIRQGQVEILSVSAGRSQRLAQRGKGEVIGEMALLDSGIRGASARAVSPVVVRSLDKEGFDALMAQHPQLIMRVTQLLTKRMNSMQKELLAPVEESLEPRLGHAFGPFLLLAELGRGGIGVVYRALDQRQHRMLALKVVTPTQAETRQRFRTECEVIGELQHANIVGLDCHGELGRHLYVAMELLEGETLEERLARGVLPLEEVASWFCPVIEALAHAHQRRIVHRDIKPANIFRCRDGTIKLLDFGLARHEESAHLTSDGKFLGTAHYFAPERIGGHYRGSELSADQYSLGATLYEALVGQPPFHDSDPMVVLMHHLQTPPKRPGLLRPELSLELEEVVVRMLSKEPGQRFPSLEQVAAELRHSLGQPPASRSPNRGDDPTVQFS